MLSSLLSSDAAWNQTVDRIHHIFPHIDALEAKERERERFWIPSKDCQQGQAVYIIYVDCGIQIILQTLSKHLMWPISFGPLLPKLWVNAHQQGADTRPC